MNPLPNRFASPFLALVALSHFGCSIGSNTSGSGDAGRRSDVVSRNGEDSGVSPDAVDHPDAGLAGRALAPDAASDASPMPDAPDTGSPDAVDHSDAGLAGGASSPDATSDASPMPDARDTGSPQGTTPVSCQDFIKAALEGMPLPPEPPPYSPAALHTFRERGELVQESCPFTASALAPFDSEEPDTVPVESEAVVGIHSDPETGLDLFVLTVMDDLACGSVGCSVYVYVDAGEGHQLAGQVTADEVAGTMHFGGLLSLVFWQRVGEGPDAYSAPFVYRIETSGPRPELVYFGELAG